MTALERLIDAVKMITENRVGRDDEYVLINDHDYDDLVLALAAYDAEKEKAKDALSAAGVTKPEHLVELFEAIDCNADWTNDEIVFAARACRSKGGEE